MIRYGLVLLIFVCAACATDLDAQSNAPTAEAAATASADPIPTEQPTPSAVALDPECRAAFEAGLEAMTEGGNRHLDAAIEACETVDDWRAAARTFPDAVGVRVMEIVFERCSTSDELEQTALCQETEHSWSPTH